MGTAAWLLVGAAAWVATGLLTAPLIGLLLRRKAAEQTRPVPDEPHDPK